MLPTQPRRLERNRPPTERTASPIIEPKSWDLARCYEAFLISRLFGSFLTIEFMFKRSDLGLNFFDHFHIRRH
jgi:hypothetical protein